MQDIEHNGNFLFHKWRKKKTENGFFFADENENPYLVTKINRKRKMRNVCFDDSVKSYCFQKRNGSMLIAYKNEMKSYECYYKITHNIPVAESIFDSFCCFFLMLLLRWIRKKLKPFFWFACLTSTHLDIFAAVFVKVPLRVGMIRIRMVRCGVTYEIKLRRMRTWSTFWPHACSSQSCAISRRFSVCDRMDRVYCYGVQPQFSSDSCHLGCWTARFRRTCNRLGWWLMTSWFLLLLVSFENTCTEKRRKKYKKVSIAMLNF